MDKKNDDTAGKPLNADGPKKSGGPWETGSDNGGGGSNGSGPKPDLPTGQEDSGKKGGNPWEPVSIEGGKGKRKDRGPSLEELLRRAGGGGGKGGGWNGMPKRADGKSYWPLIIFGLLVLWVGWTSIHRLEPAQAGVVTQFGKYNRTVDSGIRWTLPAPIEKLEKVDIGEVRTITIGSPNSKAENLILTRDANVINMAYNVRWQIKSPEQFLFQLDKPEEMVTEVAESAMRAAVANFDLIPAITTGRGNIQADVQKRMQRILDDYRSGISIQAIDIQESAAPSEVSEAFRKVNAAKQQRESYLNDARKYARQVTERALGETAEFDRIYVQYSAAPEVTKRRLYYETMEAVLSKVDKTIVEAGNVTPFLPLPEIKKRVDAKKNEVQVTGAK